MQKTQTITYSSIDVCKLLMAFLVVFIHMEAIYQLDLTRAMFYLTRTAVPFFFIAAGFLLQERLKTSENPMTTLRHYTQRVLKMYLFWTACYAPITLYMYIHGHTPARQAIYQYVKGVLLVGESHYSWHLWFLLALLVAVVAIWGMLRLHCKVQHIFLIGLLLMCIGQLMDHLHHGNPSGSLTYILDKYYALFVNTRNGLFQGLGFVSGGMLISRFTPPHYVKKHKSAIILIFAASLILFHYNLILWRLLSGATLLLACFCIELPSKPAFLTCRKMSTLIYFTHMYFLFIASRWLLTEVHSATPLLLLMTCLVSCNYILVKILKMKRLSWMKPFL